MKKIIPSLLACSVLALSFSGLASAAKPMASSASKPYIAMIAKSFQTQYWQVVYKGAKAAAKKYNVTITFEGPDAESDISQQVDQVSAAINRKPKVLCLAACDVKSLSSQLATAKKNGIPVIGFDSGVPNDTSGALIATAATDNVKAGAMAADNLFKDAKFIAAVKKGTSAKPVVLGVLSQDATSSSIIGRTNGFINEIRTKLNSISSLKNAVEVTGQSTFNKKSSKAAKVNIVVSVPPTTTQTDVQSAASNMLNTNNLIAIFASNQTAADGVYSATSDGIDLSRSKGKYKNLIVVGFDAGKNQKSAVKNQAFLGSITQDPYTIGFDAVKLAYDKIQGKKVSNVDTGAKWYNYKNMGQSDIAQLLYD